MNRKIILYFDIWAIKELTNDLVGVVLDCLQLTKPCLNVKKSNFMLHEIEYPGYVASRDGVKLQPEKVPSTDP